MYIGAVSLGQLFKTHKVLGAFVSYFGIYFFLQMITSIFIMPFTLKTIASATTSISPNEEVLLALHTFSFTLWFSIASSITLSVVLFFISNHIMKKKLNLE